MICPIRSNIPLGDVDNWICVEGECSWWMKGERCAVTSAAISLVYISRNLRKFEKLFLEDMDLPSLLLKPGPRKGV